MDNQQYIDALFGFKDYHMPLPGSNNQITAEDVRTKQVLLLSDVDTTADHTPFILPSIMIKSTTAADFLHQTTTFETNTLLETINNMVLSTLDYSREPLWTTKTYVSTFRQIMLTLRGNGVPYPLPESSCLWMYKQLWRTDVQEMLLSNCVVYEMKDRMAALSQLLQFDILQHSQNSYMLWRFCTSGLCSTQGQNSFVQECSNLDITERMRIILNCNPVPLAMLEKNPVGVLFFFIQLYGNAFLNVIAQDYVRWNGKAPARLTERMTFVREFKSTYSLYLRYYSTTGMTSPMPAFEEFLFSEFTAPSMDPYGYLFSSIKSCTMEKTLIRPYSEKFHKRMMEPDYKQYHTKSVRTLKPSESWLSLMQNLVRSVQSQEAAYRIAMEIIQALTSTHLPGYFTETTLCSHLRKIIEFIIKGAFVVSHDGECYWRDSHKALPTSEAIRFNQLFLYHPFAAWCMYDVVSGVSSATNRKAPESYIAF
ncbi:protein binding motif protein [Ranid herpesvirus 3]|uniref:Protein binding motif protein n=1 Tax=Ranid herpesvirus 3 TaxID=1987509 RepID=A0A1X9T5M5_9VIRU|nr:protein binding motif protein [Ranid herpesvirus 3]ARR28955.1 protein binding motif protein [Ranid herpesvirus 3]